MSEWASKTIEWAQSEKARRVADAQFGSTDQAAFSETVDRQLVSIYELDWIEWNLCQDWELYDDLRTRVVHYRGKCHNKLLCGSDEYPKPVTQLFKEYVLCRVPA